MKRQVLCGMALVAFLLGVVGCGKPENKMLPDAPIKSSGGVNPKTGKATKSFEAALTDPPKK